MTELHLHIGHGKTGTSYIQNTLVLSQAELARHRIAYPVSARDSGRVRRNHARISSGNGAGLLIGRTDLNAMVPEGYGKLLFSSELLFERLVADKAARRALLEACDRFDRVKVLLFVREPLDFAVSAYQQMVKRHGHVGPLRDYVMATDHLDKLAVCLDVLGATPGLKPEIRNYSKWKSTVVEIVEAWLEIPQGCLQRPARRRVNRGLSPGELAIQRGLNRLLGPSGNLFADWVTQCLPDRRIAPVRPTPEVRHAFFTKFGAQIARINALLPPAEALRTA